MQTRLITIPERSDKRGNLAFIEGEKIPFDIKRVFYMYGMPSYTIRGGHALKTCEQVLVPLAGGFSVTVLTSRGRVSYRLEQPTCGLYLPPLVWRTLHDFELDTVCLVLASEPYDANGYYLTLVDFLEAVNADSVP